ncbi:MAG: hypothetical protein ABIA59_11425 [Candidatus Latescibacterota bacterium]
MLRIPKMYLLVILAALLLLVACGKEGEQAAVDEHDGAELTTLMQSAH